MLINRKKMKQEPAPKVFTHGGGRGRKLERRVQWSREKAQIDLVFLVWD